MTIDRAASREKVAAREMARCYSERAWKSDPSFMARKGEDDPNEPRWFAPDEYAEAMWRLYLEDAKAVVAALSTLDQPAQEPVAWMVTHPEEGKDLLFLPLSEFSKEQGWTEVPLYTAPQPATLPDESR